MKIEEEKWVLMDFHRRLIAKGVPRNRYICFVDDEKDKKRILTYSSEGKAKASNKGFYHGTGVGDYVQKVYNLRPHADPEMYPVKVKVTMELL